MDYSHNFEWYDDNMAVMGVINKISKVINDTEFNEKRLKYSIMYLNSEINKLENEEERYKKECTTIAEVETCNNFDKINTDTLTHTIEINRNFLRNKNELIAKLENEIEVKNKMFNDVYLTHLSKYESISEFYKSHSLLYQQLHRKKSECLKMEIFCKMYNQKYKDLKKQLNQRIVIKQQILNTEVIKFVKTIMNYKKCENLFNKRKEIMKNPSLPKQILEKPKEAEKKKITTQPEIHNLDNLNLTLSLIDPPKVRKLPEFQSTLFYEKVFLEPNSSFIQCNQPPIKNDFLCIRSNSQKRLSPVKTTDSRPMQISSKSGNNHTFHNANKIQILENKIIRGPQTDKFTKAVNENQSTLPDNQSNTLENSVEKKESFLQLSPIHPKVKTTKIAKPLLLENSEIIISNRFQNTTAFPLLSQPQSGIFTSTQKIDSTQNDKLLNISGRNSTNPEYNQFFKATSTQNVSIDPPNQVTEYHIKENLKTAIEGNTKQPCTKESIQNHSTSKYWPNMQNNYLLRNETDSFLIQAEFESFRNEGNQRNDLSNVDDLLKDPDLLNIESEREYPPDFLLDTSHDNINFDMQTVSPTPFSFGKGFQDKTQFDFGGSVFQMFSKAE